MQVKILDNALRGHYSFSRFTSVNAFLPFSRQHHQLVARQGDDELGIA